MSQFFSTLFIIPAPIAGVLGPILKSIARVWDATWWFFLPIILAIILWEGWKFYLHVRFLKSINWVLLEIKVPKDVLKTPKAMEQIFAAAHTPYTYGIKFYDKYVKGVDEKFMSFELVGRAGETHFYLRVPAELRNLMESSIFGQYPNAEIIEVEDYLHELPHVLPSDQIDVGGFEMIFGKPNHYPLRTYLSFEEPVEEQRIDPIAQLVEAMSKMQGDQQFWMQLVVVPTGTDWVDKGEKEIRKIHNIEEKPAHKGGFLPSFDLGITLGEALRAPFEAPGAAKPKHDEKPQKSPRTVLSASEKNLTEGIANKIAKFGLQTTIRFMFIGHKGEQPPVDRNMPFAFGYIRQFNTQNLNNLKPSKEYNSAGFTVRGMFKEFRIKYKKRIMYERYTHISQDHHHAPILNIEELATLYHFPITAVTTTQLEKIESKKGSPPATLPVMEEEEVE